MWEDGGSQRLLVLDLDPPWRGAIEGAAGMARIGAVRMLSDPSRATLALEFSPDIVLWNLGSARQFDFALEAALTKCFPAADVFVAVDDANEELVVKLLLSGVTYLCDKKDGPEAFARSFAQLVGLGNEVRELSRSVHVGYRVRNWIEISAPSERKFVEGLARFVLLLMRTRLPERKRRSLGYALREIGQNAIEWGNAFDRRKRFELSFCILDDRILIKIEDEGQGFDPAGLEEARRDPLGNLVRRRAQGKRVGGYGLPIVHGLMDEVIFSEKGNAVVLSLLL